MKKSFVAAVLISAAFAAGPASAESAAYQDPLDVRTLSTIRSRFSELMERANRHDLKALHGMFWQSPSVLLVAKSAIPSEGNWAGFWGNDAVDRKLRDIAGSGPVVLTPDLSKLKIVGLTPELAESRTDEHRCVVCRTRRHAQAIFNGHQLDKGRERMENCIRDHLAGATGTPGQRIANG